MNPGKRSIGDPYPFTSKICDLLDMVVESCPSTTPGEANYWIGKGEETKTPRFSSMNALEAYCRENINWLEEEKAAAEDYDKLPPEAQSVADFLPHLSGPYSVNEEQFILAKNGMNIAFVDKSPQAPGHAALLAASWELLIMLHEYVSTDHCTGHPEHETCRYCSSMNVIRRAMNHPDEIVPLFTWFGKYKEQQQVVKAFQSRYETLSKKVSQVILDLEDRVTRLSARQTGLQIDHAEHAERAAWAVAELGQVHGELKRTL